MNKLTKKQIVLLIIINIVLIGLGFIGGFYTKILIDEAKLIEEKEKQTSLAKLMSKKEIDQLKETIKKDEEDYGDKYQEFTYNPYVYKREPDKIYFKSSKIGAFYEFEKIDKDYEHLLEVVEDRMHYSVIDDYNLNCFTPDSINRMMTSGENYIIFDYNNENLAEVDWEYNKDLIFKFSENTRLYRLVTYLSYYKEPILRKDLPKKEFAEDINVSGYEYMTYIDGN